MFKAKTYSSPVDDGLKKRCNKISTADTVVSVRGCLLENLLRPRLGGSVFEV